MCVCVYIYKSMPLISHELVLNIWNMAFRNNYSAFFPLVLPLIWIIDSIGMSISKFLCIKGVCVCVCVCVVLKCMPLCASTFWKSRILYIAGRISKAQVSNGSYVFLWFHVCHLHPCIFIVWNLQVNADG